MASRKSTIWGGALFIAVGMTGMATAQGLDPRVAGPLMQLIQAAGLQCQSGNQQACGMAQQLQQGAHELTQVQFACQQGNPQACQMYQSAVQQVMATHQQWFGGQQAQGYVPPYNQQQQAWDHQQRMQQQQFQFQQQQFQYQQQQRQNDWQHQRFMDTLRR